MVKKHRRNRVVIQPLPKPTLRDLLMEVDELRRRFKDICEQHRPESVCRAPDNTPVRFPLSVSWRPWVGDSPPSGIAEVIIEWVELFKIYLANLGRHFVDWQERPHLLERFPLHRYPFYQHDQRTSYNQIIADLDEHKRLLLVEAEKRLEILSETLPNLLRGTRKHRGITQPEAASKLGISCSTYKSWEQGKAFPGQTKHMKLKSFLEQKKEPSNVDSSEHKLP